MIYCKSIYERNDIMKLIIEYKREFEDFKNFEIAEFGNDEVTCFFSREIGRTFMDVVPKKLVKEYRQFLKTGKVANPKYRHKVSKDFEWFKSDLVENVEFQGNMFWHDIIKNAILNDGLLMFEVTQVDKKTRHYKIPSTGKVILTKEEFKEIQDEIDVDDLHPIMSVSEFKRTKKKD